MSATYRKPSSSIAMPNGHLNLPSSELYPPHCKVKLPWALSTVLKTELEHLEEAEHCFRNGYEISKRREFVEEELKKVASMMKAEYERNFSLTMSSPF